MRDPGMITVHLSSLLIIKLNRLRRRFDEHLHITVKTYNSKTPLCVQGCKDEHIRH